jgi:hypothetical protein
MVSTRDTDIATERHEEQHPQREVRDSFGQIQWKQTGLVMQLQEGQRSQLLMEGELK